MKTSAHAKVIGDYGNPNGTGAARLSLTDLPYVDAAVPSCWVAVFMFFLTVKTAGLTATELGDLTVNTTIISFPDKPGNGVNVDRVLTATWRTKNNSKIHRLTLHGVPETSTGIEKTPAGERISEAGKSALSAAIASLYKVTGDNAVIILSGIVTQKA